LILKIKASIAPMVVRVETKKVTSTLHQRHPLVSRVGTKRKPELVLKHLLVAKIGIKN